MFNKENIIAIGSDHAGFEMKQYIQEVLSKEGCKFKDYGTHTPDSVDYPDYGHAVAKDISNGTYPFGILICGTGVGISIAANRHPKVRCALCWTEEIARLTRKHNNANIIALPGRFLDFEVAANIVKVFLNEDFEGGRHQTRIDKIDHCGCGL
jgi:ribose 5-phosphate isomerase B